MEDNIGINEYVRTKDGYIEKVTETDNNYVYSDGILSYQFQGDVEIPNSYEEKSKIAKHSPNIIDLIEVGDYVNGIKVTGIMSGYVYLDKIDIETKKVKTLTDYQIKSIVTKEMFNQVKYEV